MSTFVGLVEMLIMRVDTYDKERIKQMLGIIAESAGHLQVMTNDLLTWSQIQSRNIKAQFAPYAIKELFEENEVLCRSLAQQKNIRFCFFVSEEIIVETDKSLLGAVMRNLFTNAIKYSHPGGKVKVSACVKNGNVYLSIKDNGVGMSSEKAKNLFVQKMASTPGTNNEMGTGLGLIISHECIKMLNGLIEVKCTEGKGCEFIITLPKIT